MTGRFDNKTKFIARGIHLSLFLMALIYSTENRPFFDPALVWMFALTSFAIIEFIIWAPTVEKEELWEAAAVFLIAAAAFLLRVMHLLSSDLQLSSLMHFSDAALYIDSAESVLKGTGGWIPWLPPMPSLIGMLVIALKIGRSYFAAKMAYAFLGGLTIFPVYMTARLLYGKGVAFMTSMLCAASYALIFITGAMNTEGCYLFTLSIAVCLFVNLLAEEEFARKRPILLPFFLGVSCGAAMLSRSEFELVMVLFFVMGLLKKEWGAAKKLRVALTSAFGVVLAVAPWAAHNYAVMKDFNRRFPEARLPLFVPVALNGPANFVEGHSLLSNGTYSPETFGTVQNGHIVFFNPANKAQAAILRDGYKIGWEHIKTNPVRELGLIPVKLKVFANGFANGFGLRNFPAGLEGGSESMADSFVPDSKIMLYPGALLFLLGATVVLRAGSPIKIMPLFPIGVVLFASLAFYALSRLIFPVLPYYFMIISVAIMSLWGRLNLSLPKPYLLAMIVTVGLLAGENAQSHYAPVFYKENKGGYGKFHLTIKRWEAR